MNVATALISKFGIKPAIRRVARARVARSAFDRKPALIVLTYHSIDPDPPEYMVSMGVTTHPEAFNDHMDWARRHYDIVTLSEGIRRLRGDELRRTSIAVTIDDGLRIACDYGLPILRRYEIPCTLFVNQACLSGGRNWIYDAACLEAVGKTETLANVFGPSPNGSFTTYLRWKADAEILARRSRLAEIEPALHDDHRRHLDYESLAALQDDPLIEVGNHSVDHPRFSRLDASEQQRQVRENEKALSSLANYRPLFALPFGRPGDWNFDTVSAVASSGHEFISACGGVNFAGRAGVDIQRVPSDGAGVGELEERIRRQGLGI